MATVLVVDDVPDITLALTLLFQRAGHTVVAAADPATCVKLAEHCHPDLFLLNLANCRALPLCRTLRDNAATASTPIIMLSADLRPTAGDADAAGADDYITKPFTNADVLTRAEALLAGHPAGQPRHPRPTSAG